MYKNQVEDKFKIKIEDVPSIFNDTDDSYVRVKLECGHHKNCRVKTIVKRKQRCLICKPPKERMKKEADSCDEARQNVVDKLKSIVKDINAVGTTIRGNKVVDEAIEDVFDYEDGRLEHDKLKLDERESIVFIIKLISECIADSSDERVDVIEKQISSYYKELNKKIKDIEKYHEE